MKNTFKLHEDAEALIAFISNIKLFYKPLSCQLRQVMTDQQIRIPQSTQRVQEASFKEKKWMNTQTVVARLLDHVLNISADTVQIPKDDETQVKLVWTQKCFACDQIGSDQTRVNFLDVPKFVSYSFTDCKIETELKCEGEHVRLPTRHS